MPLGQVSEVVAIHCFKGTQENFLTAPGKSQEHAGWPDHLLAPAIKFQDLQQKILGQIGQEVKATQGCYNRQLSSAQVSPAR